MAERSPGTSVPRRRLARLLRHHRELAGMTVEEVVAQQYASKPTLWRIEKGDPRVRYHRGLVENLARLYGVDDETRSCMVGLAQETQSKGWLHAYGDVIPENFELYVDLEATVTRLLWYEPELVPGLLQTKNYATVVISSVEDRDEAETLRRVQVRLARQAVLRRKTPAPPTLEIIINEAVLWRPVGGPTVMAEQLRHINDVSEWPNVRVRVVPFDAGIHQGVLSGSFEILFFSPANGDVEPTTVYLDGLCGDVYLDQKHQVREYRAAFRNLEARALDEEASREWIDQAARRFDKNE
ncbi:MAG TPA: helix-turn-helix transcriptional regulator [Micromonosporaceae bacterium]